MSQKILIIDDEPGILRLVEGWLKTNHYQVFCASDGKAGLEAAVREHPDLILLDVMMPGMDGYEVLHTLKRTAGISAVPVIMLTQKRETRSILDTQESGAVDYITKPFLPEELLKTIRVHLVFTG